MHKPMYAAPERVHITRILENIKSIVIKYFRTTKGRHPGNHIMEVNI